MSSFWNKKGEKKELFIQKSSFKRASILAILMSSITFNMGYAKEINTKESFEKIYHVYVGNEYMGAVSNEAAVDQIVKEKELVASQQYKEYSVDASSNVSIVPEQVFNNETNDVETLAKVDESLVAEATAFALLVDNEPIAYLKDAQAYEETIRLLKLQYVSQQEIDKLHANQQATSDLPPLAAGETRIVDISFKQDVAGVTKKVSPDKIMTPEEAVKFLMTGSTEKQQYQVKAGDVLGSIAKAHDLTTAELIALNPGTNVESTLRIGQGLNVTVPKSFISIEVKKEKKLADEIAFEKVAHEDATMYKGDTVVKQQGVNGKKETSYLITSENGTQTSQVALEETVVQEPKEQIEVVGTKVVSSRGTGDFVWPAVGGYISSHVGNRWGSYHRGLDIARPSNYNILASDNGVVVSAGTSGTYGNRIVVNHNNGYTTLYAHLSSINVKVGQTVEQGQVIGIMGSTGNSTGTHLHFEMEKNGELINPLTEVSQ